MWELFEGENIDTMPLCTSSVHKSANKNIICQDTSSFTYYQNNIKSLISRQNNTNFI
jgi:hypothetical protein